MFGKDCPEPSMINAPTDTQSLSGVLLVSLNFNSLLMGTLQAKRLNAGALLCCPLRNDDAVSVIASGLILNTSRFLIVYWLRLNGYKVVSTSPVIGPLVFPGCCFRYSVSTLTPL